jgi:hypothetical protein
MAAINTEEHPLSGLPDADFLLGEDEVVHADDVSAVNVVVTREEQPEISPLSNNSKLKIKLLKLKPKTKKLDNSKITGDIVYELGIETAKLLRTKQHELSRLKWQDGEANTDTEYSNLACQCCQYAWEHVLKGKYPEYKDIDITCIIPDINITFVYPDGSKICFKIELKSTKSDTLPGGTILKLDVNQTLILVKRPSKNSDIYQIKCGQYHTAIKQTDNDMFQDRSPRPKVTFSQMSELDDFDSYEVKDNMNTDTWSEHYAKCAINRVTSNKKSWQEDMVKKIMDKAVADYIKNTTDYIKNTTVEQFKIDKAASSTEVCFE